MYSFCNSAYVYCRVSLFSNSRLKTTPNTCRYGLADLNLPFWHEYYNKRFFFTIETNKFVELLTNGFQQSLVNTQGQFCNGISLQGVKKSWKNQYVLYFEDTLNDGYLNISKDVFFIKISSLGKQYLITSISKTLFQNLFHFCVCLEIAIIPWSYSFFAKTSNQIILTHYCRNYREIA